MTDHQKQIFQKVIDGRITKPYEEVFFETSERRGYFRAITKGHRDYPDYEAAWNAWENAPLKRALE